MGLFLGHFRHNKGFFPFPNICFTLFFFIKVLWLSLPPPFQPIDHRLSIYTQWNLSCFLVFISPSTWMAADVLLPHSLLKTIPLFSLSSEISILPPLSLNYTVQSSWGYFGGFLNWFSEWKSASVGQMARHDWWKWRHSHARKREGASHRRHLVCMAIPKLLHFKTLRQ